MQLAFREPRNGCARIAIQHPSGAVTVEQLANQTVTGVVGSFADLVQCRQLRLGAIAKPVDDCALVGISQLVGFQ